MKNIKMKSLIKESTRSYIGLIDKSGRIKATYVHYDGYVDGVGKTLKKYYNPKKMAKLLSIDRGAGISSLEKNIDGGEGHSWKDPKRDQTVFYGRDRGQFNGKFLTGNAGNIMSFVKDTQENYVYLYDERDGKLYYADRNKFDGLRLLETTKKKVVENKYDDMLVKGDGHVHFVVKDLATAEKLSNEIEKKYGATDYYKLSDGKVYLRVAPDYHEGMYIPAIERLVGQKAKPGSKETGHVKGKVVTEALTEAKRITTGDAKKFEKALAKKVPDAGVIKAKAAKHNGEIKLFVDYKSNKQRRDLAAAGKDLGLTYVNDGRFTNRPGLNYERGDKMVGGKGVIGITKNWMTFIKEGVIMENVLYMWSDDFGQTYGLYKDTKGNAKPVFKGTKRDVAKYINKVSNISKSDLEDEFFETSSSDTYGEIPLK